MRRYAVVVMVALALAGCAEQRQEVRTVPPTSATGPRVDPEAALAWLGGHPDPQKGRWYRAVVLSTSFDGNHWAAALMLQDGHTQAVVASGDAARAAYVTAAPGDYVRLRTSYREVEEPEDVVRLDAGAVPVT